MFLKKHCDGEFVECHGFYNGMLHKWSVGFLIELLVARNALVFVLSYTTCCYRPELWLLNQTRCLLTQLAAPDSSCCKRPNQPPATLRAATGEVAIYLTSRCQTDNPLLTWQVTTNRTSC